MPKIVGPQGRSFALADPVVRNRFLNNILTMCRRWREEIKGLKRNPVFHMPNPTIEQRRMLSLKFGGIRINVQRTLEDLERHKTNGISIPDHIMTPVVKIDTEIKLIMERLLPPGYQP